MDQLLSKESVTNYIDKLRSQNISSDRMKQHLSSLARFTQWSHKKGYLKDHKASSIAIDEGMSQQTVPHYQQIIIKQPKKERNIIVFFAFIAVIFILLLASYFLFMQKMSKHLTQEALGPKYQGKRTILFQGRLTDHLGNPIKEKTDVRFTLYDDPHRAKLLYQSGACPVQPAQDGILSIEIGNNCGSSIDQSIFLENQQVYLGITAGKDNEMTPRQQVSNVSYADNSNALQGFSAGSVDNDDPAASQGAQINTVPVINQFGNLVIAARSPRLWSTSGTFQFRGQALTFATDTGSAGDIVFNPDNGGNTFFSAGNVGIRTENPLSFDLQIGGHAGPDKNNTYNLGSSAFRWDSIYTNNLLGADTGILGYLQRSNNVVSLTHLSDDLLIGDSASPSAQIKLTGASGSIGIGTQTPQERFTLGSSGNFAVEMSIPKNLSVQTASGGALKEGTYYFKITASDGVGWTIGSSEVSCRVNGTSLTRCALFWDTVIGATSYRIYKGISSGGQDRYQTSSANLLNYDGDGGATLGSVPSATTAYVNKWSAVGSSWLLGGNIGLGTTNPSKGKLQIDASRGVLLYTNNTGTGNSIEDASGAKLTASGVWTDASDQIKKKNINVLSYGLSELLKLNPVQYLWKDSGISDIGFIAQEVQKIIPELVYGAEGQLSMSYGHLTALIVKSIQEQQYQVNKLFENIKTLSVQDLFVTHTFVSPVIETNDLTATGKAVIHEVETPRINADPISHELTFGGISKLIIQGLDNAHIAVFDDEGNATISGALTSEAIHTNTASIAGVLTAHDATISATLKAQHISADNITAIENKLSNLQSTYTEKQGLTDDMNNIQKLLAEIRTQPLPNTLDYQTNTDQMNVTDLTVSDSTHLYNAAIANSLTIGSLIFKDDSLLSLSWELKLSALSTINLLDGAVIIAKDGSLTTRGGLITQGGIRTNEIRPINSDNDLSVRLNTKSDILNSNQIKNSKFKIQNNLDEEVAHINSSGSAYFKDGISVGKYTDATSSAVIIAAADNFNQNGIYAPAIQTDTQTAGVGLLPAYANEVIVYTHKLSDNSLIYITPTTQTQNKTLFVAQKESCLTKSNALADETMICKPYFKVALDKGLNTDIKFNWWIVK